MGMFGSSATTPRRASAGLQAMPWAAWQQPAPIPPDPLAGLGGPAPAAPTGAAASAPTSPPVGGLAAGQPPVGATPAATAAPAGTAAAGGSSSIATILNALKSLFGG